MSPSVGGAGAGGGQRGLEGEPRPGAGRPGHGGCVQGGAGGARVRAPEGGGGKLEGGEDGAGRMTETGTLLCQRHQPAGSPSV